MTDERMTEGGNPADYTVDQVNDYLATVTDDAERARVLGAEGDEANGGKARKGILEGTHDAPTPDDDKTTAGLTFAEAAEQVPVSQGESYEKGYQGYVPSKDPKNPAYEDLTLQGVLNRDA